jgi:inosine/xanthosine triphosphatase
MTIRVGVGSTNPVKQLAVKDAFMACFPKDDIEDWSRSASSGVADQPMTLSETMLGARNRALAVMSHLPHMDFWVGLEGGVFVIDDVPQECGRICVLKAEPYGRVAMSESGTLSFPLGDSTYELLKQGKDLNEVMEMLTGEPELGSQRGFYGYVTNDLISRQAAYTQAVVVAITFFLHPELNLNMISL